MSRNRPETCSVTSTRGKSSRACGRISKPTTRALAVSQRGATPISASACAKSSPPVRMVALPQRSSMTCARIFAMRLRVARHDFPRGAAADVIGRLRRRMARIDAIEIAARRHHVGAPARRRAGGAGLDETALRARRSARGVRRRRRRCARDRRRRGRRHAARRRCAFPSDRTSRRRGARASRRYRSSRVTPHSSAEPAALGFVENGAGDETRATRVERRGGRIFVEQRLDRSARRRKARRRRAAA